MTDHEEQPGLVSIIIPCYNAEAYVGEAIESALNQTYEPIEVIVIDDGSTDGSLDVIRSFGDRITWQAGENRGACHARNWGLRRARGAFVKFLDADDVLVPDVLEAQVAQMQSLGERTIVYCDSGMMDENGKCRRVGSHRPRKETEDPVAYLLKKNIHVFCPLHRRHLLDEINGFDERLPRAQEYNLHLRLCLSGVRFRYEPRVGAYQRRHDGPDRITNQNRVIADPSGELKRIQRRHEVIEQAVGSSIPQPICDILARQTWRSGRAVLRAGHPEKAKEYFETAQSWSPRRCVVGHPVYRLGVRVLGPIITERFRSFRPSSAPLESESRSAPNS